MSIELKIKIKSLADEARTIRAEERKSHGTQRSSLREHRVGIVRREARASLLAYGYLRNKQYRRMEQVCRTDPNWRAVERMIKKYGELKQPIEEWKNEPRRERNREHDRGEAEDSASCAA